MNRTQQSCHAGNLQADIQGKGGGVDSRLRIAGMTNRPIALTGSWPLQAGAPPVRSLRESPSATSSARGPRMSRADNSASATFPSRGRNPSDDMASVVARLRLANQRRNLIGNPPLKIRFYRLRPRRPCARLPVAEHREWVLAGRDRCRDQGGERVDARAVLRRRRKLG